MILRDLVYDIKSSVNAEDVVNQELDNRLVINFIDNRRSIWLKNEYNKNRSIEDNVVQRIDGVEMKVVDASTFSAVSTSHRILESRVAIPRPLELHNKYVLKVRNIVLGRAYYNTVRYDDIMYKGNGVFNRKMIYPFIYDNKLYIKLNEDNPKIALLTQVTVEGVFEKPSEVMTINSTQDILDQDYPISRHMWGYIKDEIINRDIKQIYATEQDTLQNVK